MSPPADVARIGERRQRVIDSLLAESLTTLDSAYPYLGEQVDPWSAAVADSAPVLLEAQQVAVATSPAYLDDVLEAQGAATASEIKLRPQGFIDHGDGGGSWLKNLIYAPTSAYQAAITGGYGTAVAAARGRYVAQVIVKDGLRDSSRAADSLGMFGRKVGLTVRMLRGKTCGRCAVLAGRIYKVEGFRRHLNCDCYNVPFAGSESRAGKWRTDPAAYFNSLSASEQDEIFGEAGAIAIRASTSKETAISQVVNADQGVYTVDTGGRQLQATRSGTTVRGLYGGYEVQPDGSFVRRTRDQLTRDKSISPYRFAQQPRLMPDQILELSREFGWSREMTISQFRRFGYVY